MKKYLLIILTMLLVTLLVSCSDNNYKLTYIVDDIEYKVFYLSEGEIINLIDEPTKEGYTFKGWNNSLSVMPNKDITISGSFIINEYEIIFFDDDGVTVIEKVIVKHNELPKPKDVISDKGFIGWDREIEVATKNTSYKAVYEEKKEEFNLPIVNIELNEYNLEDVNREDYVDATFSLTNASEFDLVDLKLNFRGRGHGSWEFNKKGYKLKFDKKQSLFGLEKNKHFALVGNGHDNSMMRHNIAYSLVNDNLDYIDYTTSVHIVEVYINGNYQGVYSLFEHNRVAKGRVDIESNYGKLDTGYFIEYDAYGDESGIEGIDYFRVSGLKYPFEVKSPKPKNYIEEGLTEEEFREQINFIKNYMENLVSAILNKNYELVKELADINSLVDMYIIHEFMKNTDTGWSSFYFSKEKGEKIKANATWDFDMSSGLSRGDSSPYGLYVSNKVNEVSDFTSSEIYTSLMKIDEFENLVKERFIEVKDGFLNTIENMFEEIKSYEDSFIRDDNKWMDGKKVYKNEQEFLYHWLKSRHSWFSGWAES